MSRAVFEGMLLPGTKTVLARGPFTVDVHEHISNRMTRWRAHVVGAMEFMENKKPMERKTEAEAQAFVEFQFNKKVKEWQ